MPTLAQRLEKQGLEKGMQLGILAEKQNVLIMLMQKKFGINRNETELINNTNSTLKLENALQMMVVTDLKDEVLRELK